MAYHFQYFVTMTHSNNRRYSCPGLGMLENIVFKYVDRVYDILASFILNVKILFSMSDEYNGGLGLRNREEVA